MIGVLHHFNATGSANKNQNAEHLSHKISILLKDENNKVRIKAANALGYLYGDI